MEKTRYVPRLVVLELTRRCFLECIHCRANSNQRLQECELSTAEWMRIIDEITSFSKPILILSGGEALLREDIFEIISYSSKKGLTPVLATCGISVTLDKIKKLKSAGIKRISISIDGKDAQSHDSIRSQEGVFEKAILTAKMLREENIELQINTTVTRQNVGQLTDILDLSKRLGAYSFHPFFLVPIGRAKDLVDEEISPQIYEETLYWFYKRAKDSAIEIKPTCAPHYSRISIKEGRQLSGGCLGGKYFAFISSKGLVQICGFLDVVCGNVREDSFKTIWENSEVFNQLRDFNKYKGKCGECEYLRICSGCRARAYAASSDYLGEEPNCVYQPSNVKF